MDLEITACPPASTGPQLEILLDNIRSAENVGAMLRTADGAGIRHLHITGMTPSPGQVKVSKAALGAEFTVPWTQHWNGLQAVLDLKSQGYHIWSLEGGEDSVSLFDLQPPAGPRPILLVVGNEIAGVDPQILSESEKVISIPMLGIKKSLNVATALGIAAYTIRFGCT
jgi:tRNA G18 (ribose-2'-O)-methylase SpoU